MRRWTWFLMDIEQHFLCLTVGGSGIHYWSKGCEPFLTGLKLGITGYIIPERLMVNFLSLYI